MLQAKFLKKQEEKRASLQAFVDRFRAKATKARQAQSRLKMLERMEEVSAVWTRRCCRSTSPRRKSRCRRR